MRRASRRGRRGTAAVEFGLVLVPLSALLFGIVEYGFVLFTAVQVTNAAREGARAESVGDDGLARVARYLSNAGLDTAAQISIQRSGGDVQVLVTYPFAPLVGLLPTPRTLHGRVVMRLEGGS